VIEEGEDEEVGGADLDDDDNTVVEVQANT
jgi:hypothetical protein